MNKKLIIFTILGVFLVLLGFVFVFRGGIIENTIPKNENKQEVDNRCIFYINQTELKEEKNYILGYINKKLSISVKNCKEEIVSIVLDGEVLDIKKGEGSSFILPFLILPQKHEIRINDFNFTFYYLLVDNFEQPLKNGRNNNWTAAGNLTSWKIGNNSLNFKNLNQTGYSSISSQYKIGEDFLIEFSLLLKSKESKQTVYLLSNSDTIFLYSNKIGIKTDLEDDKYAPFNIEINKNYRIRITRIASTYKIYAEEVDRNVSSNALYEFSTNSLVLGYDRKNKVADSDYWGIGSWSNQEFEIYNIIFGEY
ncbi:MAG: hypothetical protein WCX74_00250 [Candidatus Paceibacterota bacterium]